MCVGEFGIARGADAHLAVKPRAMRNRLSALNLQVLTAAQRPTTTRTLRSSSRRAWLAGVGVAGACARTRAFLGRAFEPHSAGGRAVRRAASIEGGVVWIIAFVCYDGICDLMNLNCDGRGAWLLGVWAGWDPAGCNRGHLLWRRCLILCRFSFALRLGCADARSSLAFAHPSSIFRVACDAQGGAGRVVGGARARCRAAPFSTLAAAAFRSARFVCRGIHVCSRVVLRSHGLWDRPSRRRGEKRGAAVSGMCGAGALASSS